METSAVRAQLLVLLGFPAGSHPGEAAIETARTKLCGMLQLPASSTDEMIIDVARRIGYEPASKSELEEQSKSKPIADATELANIKAKKTTSGLSSLSSVKNTQSGIKPLHSRAAAAKSGETPAEGEEAPSQDADAQQLAADKRMQAQALRTSAQFRAVEKQQSVWQKITGMFKKESE
ncbi:MAG TPA: hypothetical protein V6D22_14055 [Candidatus Obscuribacterales bacterium]